MGGTGAGWEGTALLNHGSYIKLGCLQFVFSIVDQHICPEPAGPPGSLTVPRAVKPEPMSLLKTHLKAAQWTRISSYRLDIWVEPQPTDDSDQIPMIVFRCFGMNGHACVCHFLSCDSYLTNCKFLLSDSPSIRCQEYKLCFLHHWNQTAQKYTPSLPDFWTWHLLRKRQYSSLYFPLQAICYSYKVSYSRKCCHVKECTHKSYQKHNLGSVCAASAGAS